MKTQDSKGGDASHLTGHVATSWPAVGVQGSHHIDPAPLQSSRWPPVGYTSRKLAECRARMPGARSTQQGGRGQKGASPPVSPAAPTPVPPVMTTS